MRLLQKYIWDLAIITGAALIVAAFWVVWFPLGLLVLGFGLFSLGVNRVRAQ